MGPALHRTVARRVGHHVRPVGQPAPFLEREVEQRRQGHGGQFFGHQVDPIEHLADRQAVEDEAGALADDRREILQVGRRHHRADGAALLVVARRVHGDEAGSGRPLGHLGLGLQALQGDAVGGGEHLVIGVHRHDVGPFAHRPVGPVGARRRVVDRRLGAQALEVGPHGVGLEETRLGRIEGLQRLGPGPRAGLVLQIYSAVAHRECLQGLSEGSSRSGGASRAMLWSPTGRPAP